MNQTTMIASHSVIAACVAIGVRIAAHYGLSLTAEDAVNVQIVAAAVGHYALAMVARVWPKLLP